MKKNPLTKSFEIGLKDRGRFDWPNVNSVLDKVTEELNELKESLKQNPTNQVHELGDLLFTIAQAARHLNIDPNMALEIANERYIARFTTMSNLIKKEGLKIEDLSLNEIDFFWIEAKKSLKCSEEKTINEKFGFKS